MSRRARTIVFVAAALPLAGVMLWGLAGLPAFGDYRHAYGLILNHVALTGRHVTNAVSATVFDFRGFDTMGEEFILFAAAMGAALLLRHSRAQEEARPLDRPRSEGVRLLGSLLAPVAVLLGLWLAAFGYVTPGGGFQGGVVLAGGLLLLWAAGSYRAYRASSPMGLVDFAEGLGAGAYVAVGLAALAVSTPFLHNLLGAGQTGTLRSGGSIGLLNWASALEVAAANVLIFHEFLQERALEL